MTDIPPEISSGYDEIVNILSKNIEGTTFTWGHFFLVLAFILLAYWYFEMRKKR